MNQTYCKNSRIKLFEDQIVVFGCDNNVLLSFTYLNDMKIDLMIVENKADSVAGD